jgi:hypothetical protein
LVSSAGIASPWLQTVTRQDTSAAGRLETHRAAAVSGAAIFSLSGRQGYP